MKSRVVLGGLAVIGIFALSATAAQAGGGPGSPASLTTFFECQVIHSGTNVGEVVNTCNTGLNTCTSGDGLINEGVKVGTGVLLCRQVDVKIPEGSYLTPAPSDLIKCYTLTRKGQKESSGDQDFTDVFTSETNSVSDQPGYLCAPVASP